MTLQKTILLAITGTLMSPVVYAQSGFHIDRHRHVVHDRHGHVVHDHRGHVVHDRHGHVIGRSHHEVIRHNSRYVVPHFDSLHHGTYALRNGVHLYYPQTASLDAVAVAPTPEQITFGSFGHVDDLAVRLETLMNDLCLDLYYNYSHNPGFHETYAEAYTLLETAKYIHDAEHHNDRDAIRARLGGADALFHHVQEDFQGWSRIHRRQIGTMGILTKMEMAEATLHHLMNDVGVTGAIGPEVAGVPTAELAPLPGSIVQP